MSPPHFLHFIRTTPFLKITYVLVYYSKTSRVRNGQFRFSFLILFYHGSTSFFLANATCFIVTLNKKINKVLPFLSINAD